MNTSQLSRRSLVTTAAALPALAVPAVAVAAVAADEPDPVYALIAAHKQACQQWSDAVDVEAELYPGDPRLPAAEAEAVRHSALKEDCLNRLHSATPSTVIGVAALAEYYCEIQQLGWDEVSEEGLFEALANIGRVLRLLAVRS